MKYLVLILILMSVVVVRAADESDEKSAVDIQAMLEEADKAPVVEKTSGDFIPFGESSGFCTKNSECAEGAVCQGYHENYRIGHCFCYAKKSGCRK